MLRREAEMTIGSYGKSPARSEGKGIAMSYKMKFRASIKSDDRRQTPQASHTGNINWNRVWLLVLLGELALLWAWM